MLQFGEHAGVLLDGGLTRLDDDLFGDSDGLLSLLLLHAGGRGVRFLDQFGRLRVGLQHGFPTLGFGLGEFSLYFFRACNSRSDLLTPLLQHFENWLVGISMKKKTDNGEADDLGNQMRPIHTKRPRNLFDLPPTLRLGQQNQSIHTRLSRCLGAGYFSASCPAVLSYLTRNRA